jgi:hypothetical protein
MPPRDNQPCCDGLGQVHHCHGALSYTTPCQNPECREARDRDFMTIDATGTWAECEREDKQQ